MIRTRTSGRVLGAAKALALPILLIVALAGYAGPQVSPATSSPDQESYRISVSVDLVVLHATVLDRKGRFVSDLSKEHFEVFEDGVPQSIRLFRHEDVPVTVGLVVDHSGSMRAKLPDVVSAARTFVQSSNPEDEMFVINFNEHVSVGLPEAIRFTNRSDELERAISGTPATGMTALYDAIGEGLVRSQAGSREKKVLIVISDGGDNASVRRLDQVLKMAGQSSVLIYTLGIFDAEDPDRNPGVLHRLARETGGESFIPGPLDHALAEACRTIATDIRHQYTIGYFSTNASQSSAYRAIRVAAKSADSGKLSVRTRAGYIPGVAPQPVKSAK